MGELSERMLITKNNDRKSSLVSDVLEALSGRRGVMRTLVDGSNKEVIS